MLLKQYFMPLRAVHPGERLLFAGGHWLCFNLKKMDIIATEAHGKTSFIAFILPCISVCFRGY